MNQTTSCNTCFESKDESTRKFYCTSCSHVFCSTCLNNYENFCLLCKCQCKVLEINEDLPIQVKLFFDNSSFDNSMSSASQTYHFQENQTHLYTEKCKSYVNKYHKTKSDILKLIKIKEDLKITMEKERAIMEKLKQAYRYNMSIIIKTKINILISRTGNITKDLFTLGNPQISSSREIAPINSISTAERSNNSSNFFTSGAASQSISCELSSSSSNNNIQPRRTQQTRRNSVDINWNVSKLSQNSKTSTQSSSESARNIFVDTRKNLLDNTLRNMQKASQAKYLQNRHNK